MKEESISIKITVPLYFCNLGIHVTKNLEKTLNDVNYDGDLIGDAYCVFDTDITRTYDLVFRYDRMDYGMIAHECFHLTHIIMRDINKRYDVENDEPEAYLIQFLVGAVYDFLKKNKIKLP